LKYGRKIGIVGRKDTAECASICKGKKVKLSMAMLEAGIIEIIISSYWLKYQSICQLPANVDFSSHGENVGI